MGSVLKEGISLAFQKKKCLHGTVKGALILLWLYATIPKMTTGLGDVQEQGMSKGWRCLSQGRSS